MGARSAFLAGLLLGGGPIGHAAPAAGVDLDVIRETARQGAPQLAERLLVRHQPAHASDPAAWFDWERERAALLRRQGRWATLAQRLQEVLREPVAQPIAVWARGQLVAAQLDMGRPDAALDGLRGLLWVGPLPGDAATLASWQRRIATAYLRAGDAADAYRAARHLDRESRDADTALLRARIAIQVDRPAEAVAELEGVDTPEAVLLRGLAVLRAQPERAREVLKIATESAARTRLQPHERQQAWALMAEAAQRAGHLPGRLSALEHLFSADHLSPDLIGSQRPRLAQLWQAYLDYGQEVAGDAVSADPDPAGVRRMAESVRRENPFAARGLYAIAISAGDAAAAVALLDLLAEAEWRVPASLRLFSEVPTLTAHVAGSEALRQRLIDLAIDAGAIDLAANWSADPSALSAQGGGFDQRLRQARVLLLGGRERQAIAVLLDLVHAPELDEAAPRDRFRQVLFDLQTADQHGAAIELFDALRTRPLMDSERRELWYWIGDSFKARGDAIGAARAYLASAGYPDPYAMDPWAQTARYQAAEQLVAAGLYLDAQDIYRRLLGVTRDPARRASLNSRLQRLKLQARGGAASAPH